MISIDILLKYMDASHRYRDNMRECDEVKSLIDTFLSQLGHTREYNFRSTEMNVFMYDDDPQPRVYICSTKLSGVLKSHTDIFVSDNELGCTYPQFYIDLPKLSMYILSHIDGEEVEL